MREVSMIELKRHISSLVRAAEAGERIVITRHKRPVACLCRAGEEHVHVGRRWGKASLKPFLRNATRGRYLQVLEDDRRR